MTTCEDLKDLILFYAGGAADPDERRAVLDHLRSGCPRCAGRLAEAEVDDRASGRQVTAGVAVLGDEDASPRQLRGDASADAVAVVLSRGSPQPNSQEVFVRAPGAQEEGLGRANGADVEIQRSVAVRVERDDGSAVGLEVEAVQEGAVLEEGSSRRGAATVVEVPVALDTGDPRAFPVERPCAGYVIVPVGQRLPPELELDVPEEKE